MRCEIRLTFAILSASFWISHTTLADMHYVWTNSPSPAAPSWTQSLPGVVVHAALLLGAVAAIGMVLP